MLDHATLQDREPDLDLAIHEACRVAACGLSVHDDAAEGAGTVTVQSYATIDR